MAINRNPCEDVKPLGPVVTKTGVKLGGPVVVDLKKGNKNEPDVVDEAPAKAGMPFPQPFRQQDSEQGQSEGQVIENEVPNRRAISTATREVTIIPNSMFFDSGKGATLADIKHILLRGNSATKAQVNHGSIWFSHRSKEDKENADLFRWSLFNFWTSMADREGIVNKPTGGHENIYSYPNQNVRFQNEFMEKHCNTIRPLSRLNGGSYKLATETVVPSPNAVQEPGVYTEILRFALWNGISNQEIRSDLRPEQRSRDFLKAYAPSAFSEMNSDYNHANLMMMFSKMYLYGRHDGNNWNDLRDELEISSAAQDFFREGVLRKAPALLGMPWFWDWSAYRDFVFDAPVAFYEEELNGMLMAPFHSAKITKKVGNLDFVNLKGYENELEVPNVYHYYNALELQREWEPNSTESDIASIAKSQILNRYQTAETEEVYTTPKNLKFPSDRVESLEKINEFMKGYAENYVEIKINTTQGGHINSLLQRSKMDRLLLETLYPATAPDYLGNPLSRQPTKPRTNWESSDYQTYPNTKFETKVAMVLDDSFKSSNPEQNSIEETLNDRAVSDIPLVIKDGFYRILKEHMPNSENNGFQHTNRDEYPLFYGGWNNISLLRLEETIRSQIFVKELEEFIANGRLQRSYSDLLSGERAYSEVVGFAVHKYEILETGEEALIQTFALADSNEIGTISFLDSQVMPYKKYRYKIFSINFVLGTEYAYPGTDQHRWNFFDLKIHSRLGVYLIEAPFFEQVVEIRDMPPLPPQVSFLPTQGVDDKIKILLTMNYGEVKEPWLTRTEEYKKGKGFKEKLKTKYGMDKNGIITWKTDSIPDAYHVARINVPPENMDYFFKASLRKEDPESIRKHYLARNKARMIEHDMEPNKYYYYMFRAVDNYKFGDGKWNNENALYSNPTEVFRIRMVSYANGVFLEVDPYEMVENVKTDNIAFERLLKISPSFEQTLINYSNVFKKLKDKVRIPENSIEASRKAEGLLTDEQYIAGHHEFQKSAPTPEELSLGNREKTDDSIWSKKFKIRVRSKDSGKALDFNVKFAQDTDDLTSEQK